MTIMPDQVNIGNETTHKLKLELKDDMRWTYYESSHDNPFYQFAIQNKYFHQLKNQYQKTVFYQTAIRECTYLQDFISKN